MEPQGQGYHRDVRVPGTSTVKCVKIFVPPVNSFLGRIQATLLWSLSTAPSNGAVWLFRGDGGLRLDFPQDSGRGRMDL